MKSEDIEDYKQLLGENINLKGLTSLTANKDFAFKIATMNLE